MQVYSVGQFTSPIVYLTLIVCLAGCESASRPTEEPSDGDSATTDVPSGKPERDKLDAVATTLRGKPIPQISIRSLAFHPDGKQLLVGSGDGWLTAWDVAEHETIWTYQAHADWVFDVEWSSAGNTFLTGGGDNLIILWARADETHAPKKLKELTGHTDDVHGIAQPDDGKHLISGSDDTTVRVWTVDTNESNVLSGHQKQVTSVAVDSDGRLAASGSRDSTVRLWDLKALKMVSTLSGHASDVLSVAFSPDGTLVASASYDKTCRLWDVTTGECLRTFEGHTDWVFSVTFTPDGRHIVSGAGDKSVAVWNLDTGELVDTASLEADIADIAVAPNGTMIAAGLSNGVVVLLNLVDSQLELRKSLHRHETKSPPETKHLSGPEGLSHEEYLSLHSDILKPDAAEFIESAARLSESGDEFTLELFGQLEMESLSATSREIVEKAAERIRERISMRSESEIVAEVLPMLERAAYSDLTCHQLEGTLPVWAHKSLHRHLQIPGVRHELTRIRQAPAPENEVQIGFGVVRLRVNQYIDRLITNLDVEEATPSDPR